jgi:hypothetical protein
LFSVIKTILIKYGEGKVINFAYFMGEDKIAAERFRLKNKGEFIKENAKTNSNRGVNT